MSMRSEMVNAKHSGADWYGPLQEMGGSGEFVPAGQYAIGLDSSDGGIFFVGTAEEIEAWTGRIAGATQQLKDHAARPLGLDDFDPDEDGNYPCPRCQANVFEPNQHTNLGDLVHAVSKHVVTHNSKEETDGC